LPGTMRGWIMVALAACGNSGSSEPPPPSTPSPSPSPSPLVAPTLDATVARLWPDGCFAMRDEAGRLVETDHARCAAPRRPYSTFKLANALIGVDAGLLDGPDAPMTWDRARVPDEDWYQDAWRKPQTLRTAFQLSALPYFRTLALDLGETRMRRGVAQLHYGNQDISGGLDKFWLSGGLRISALEQIAFVDALAHRKLDISPHAMDVVAEISAQERTPAYVVHGKTGSGSIEGHQARDRMWLVWQVGWIERGAAIVPYAGWMEATGVTIDEARAMRKQRVDASIAAIVKGPRT
jgi:beta-lactamase class D